MTGERQANLPTDGCRHWKNAFNATCESFQVFIDQVISDMTVNNVEDPSNNVTIRGEEEMVEV